MSILNNRLLYYQMCINLAVFGSLQKFLVQHLHPDIKEVQTFWPKLYMMMKQPIFIPVKCSFILNIQFSFQPVSQHIDLLLLSGICMHRISKHDFFAESAMKMTKVAI